MASRKRQSEPEQMVFNLPPIPFETVRHHTYEELHTKIHYTRECNIRTAQNLFRAQLKQIDTIDKKKIDVIISKYPVPSALMETYHAMIQTGDLEATSSLLVDLELKSSSSGRIVRVGPKSSKEIAYMYTCKIGKNFVLPDVKTKKASKRSLMRINSEDSINDFSQSSVFSNLDEKNGYAELNTPLSVVEEEDLFLKEEIVTGIDHSALGNYQTCVFRTKEISNEGSRNRRYRSSPESISNSAQRYLSFSQDACNAVDQLKGGNSTFHKAFNAVKSVKYSAFTLSEQIGNNADGNINLNEDESGTSSVADKSVESVIQKASSCSDQTGHAVKRQKDNIQSMVSNQIVIDLDESIFYSDDEYRMASTKPRPLMDKNTEKGKSNSSSCQDRDFGNVDVSSDEGSLLEQFMHVSNESPELESREIHSSTQTRNKDHSLPEHGVIDIEDGDSDDDYLLAPIIRQASSTEAAKGTKTHTSQEIIEIL